MSGTLAWNVSGQPGMIVVGPGEEGFIPLSGPPSAADYTVTFAQGTPGPGESISMDAQEVGPGGGFDTISGYTLDLGGALFGVPAQLAIVYADSSGAPRNISLENQCVLPIDVNDLRGRITTAPGMSPAAVRGVDVAGAGARLTVLRPGRPNPFSPATTFEYHLGEASPVELTVHDVAGRRVRLLVSSGRQEAGRYAVSWEGRDDRGQAVPAGVYYIRLGAGDLIASRSVVLLK